MVSTVRIISFFSYVHHVNLYSDECQQKYGSATVWKICCGVFDFLNLAAVCYVMSSCFSIFSPSSLRKFHRSLMAQLSAYMEGFHLRFVPLTQYEPFLAHKKFLTKVPSVVCSFCFILLFSTTNLFQNKDLMWSDPEDIENWAVSPRGAGWLFGGSVVKEVNIPIYPIFFPDLLIVPCVCASSSITSIRSILSLELIN